MSVPELKASDFADMADDAVVVARVDARSRSNVMAIGGPDAVLASVLAWFSSTETSVLITEVSALASFSTDDEWPACRRVLLRLFPEGDVAQAVARWDVNRNDWRERVFVVAWAKSELAPTSCWGVLAAELSRIEGRRCALLVMGFVKEAIENPRGAAVSRVAELATDERWPAVRECLETLRIDLPWADQFRQLQGRLF